MADDLDYIETLDDLSNTIKLARQQIEGHNVLSLERQSSVRSGVFTVSDLSIIDPDEDGEIEDPTNRSLRDLLFSWQSLVDALFSQRTFLEYAPSLENCVAQLSDIDESEMKKTRDLVDLMKRTVEHHDQHPESAELRYVTLLEVVLSYYTDWRPSSSINEIWEELDLHVESDCEATDFRRVAYKVLVQLPWVPPSNALFFACGYDVSEAIGAALPEHLSAKFDQINSGPVLRSDKVHQTIENLPDDEAFTITITFVPEDGSSIDDHGDGMGKTTLAALLASHPSIQDRFTVFWTDLSQGTKHEDRIEGISYQQYLDCLRGFCDQIGVAQNWPDCIMRSEDAPIRLAREMEHMASAKEGMTKLMEGLGQDILVVLDGVYDERIFEWFFFREDQSSIVVSQSSYIPRTTCTIEMEVLGEDEAIELFAREASNDPSHPILRTLEARTIFELCLFQPLILRTAARWFKMKQVTAGFAKALEELNLELSVLKNNPSTKSDGFKVLSEIMNLMLSPSTRQGGSSKVLKLCLASTSVVFGMDKVPLDTVLALWSQILTHHQEVASEIGGDVSRQELSKRVWFLAEAFIHLGLFSFSEDEGVVFVKLHHHLYMIYGISLIIELQGGETTKEETSVEWHSAFVTGYNARLRVIKESEGELVDTSRPYVLRRIIMHMTDAKAIPKVIDMLKDDRFCRERLSQFGWMKGALLHVEDCQLLRDRAAESKNASATETQKVVLSCLKKMSLILSEEPDIADETRIEKVMALHFIGFTQAVNKGVSEALTSYKNAMLLMSSASHPFNAVIIRDQAILHLERNDNDKASKKLKACLKVLKDSANDEGSYFSALQSEVSQLRGDALAAGCDYVGAETMYEEALELTQVSSKIETGTALYRRARLHQTMGELNQAISALTECINWKLNVSERTSRNLAHAYSVAGDIYAEFQENEKAIRQFESAFETLSDLGVDEANDNDYHLLKGKIEFLKNDSGVSKESFEIARKLIRESPSFLMDQSAYDLRVIGKMCMDLDDKTLAKDILEEGIDLTQDRPDSLERACILFELGDCLFELKETRDAIVCLEEALKIRKTKLGDCELVLDTQITLGSMYKNLAMNQEYLSAAKDVMYLTDKLYRGEEGKSAKAVFGVGEAYEALGDYTESVVMFEECRELLKRALGGDHLDIISVLQRLGNLHSQFHHFESSFDSYVGALEIGRANLEVEHPQLGEILYRLGIVCHKRGEYETARDYLQEALDIFKDKEMARETCLTLVELGNVYRLTKDADTAIMCYERCYTFMDDRDSDPALLANLHLAFGHARISRRQTVEAQECFDSALKNRTARLGKDHPSTAHASRSLGIAKYMLKSYAEARIYLEDFVRVMEAQQTVNSTDYILALLLVGEVNHSEARFDDAKRCWIRAKSTIGEHPSLTDKIPGLEEILIHRMENATTAPQESKSLFSRFTELARFEDEVSAEQPIEERLHEIIVSCEFIDD